MGLARLSPSQASLVPFARDREIRPTQVLRNTGDLLEDLIRAMPYSKEQ